MKKFYIAFLYLVLHPVRALKIINLYRLLKGRYRLTIILAHSYREAFYRKKKNSKTNQIDSGNIKDTLTVDNQQVIINLHYGLLHSGGLTDRLKGICTLYRFAKNQNFKYKIYFVSPFNLEKYLLPNIYDWTIEERQISYDLKTTAIYTWEDETLTDDFFRVNRNKKQLHINCNSAECFPDYSELFHNLFKPSPFLNDKVQYHIAKLGGCRNYISVSFRFQNLLGEFEEGQSRSLDEKQITLLINRCLSAINELKNKHADVVKILLTSDSNVFREIAATKYPFIYTFILPEEIGHIDYAVAGKGKELTAFLDMFLIAGAKNAYQIRTAEMYNSDFPKMAAKLNNVPYNLISI